MKKYFEDYKCIDNNDINGGMEFAVRQILHVLPEFTDYFEKAYSEGGFYKPTGNVDWTTGFWTGEIWLAYEYVLDNPDKFEADAAEKLKSAAQVQMESFLDRIDNKIEVDHHDMGFLYSPSCVAGYKLIGSGVGREAAIKAADQLLTRFHPVGGFLQAWGSMDAPENYRLIIDCLNNLPLLYWASDITGDKKYREVADKHIHTAISIHGIHFSLILRQELLTMVLHVRATGTVQHGQEVRRGAYMDLLQRISIRREKSIFLCLRKLRSIFLTIFLRIWFLTGILNLQMVMSSQEIHQVHRLQHVECLR